MSQQGQTQFVTGPGTAKVYVKPNFGTAPLYYSTYNSIYSGWQKHDGEWIHINQPLHVKGTIYVPPRDGYSAVRRAIQLWNQRNRQVYGQQTPKIFELTKDKQEADTYIEDSDPQHPAIAEKDEAAGTGAYPMVGQVENIHIREGFENDVDVIAHELGHTAGLKHHHDSGKPSIMKYQGDPGEKDKPTKFDVKKVHNKKSPETQVGIGASTGAKVNEHKPKGKVAHSGPANKRQVTGSGGKVRK